MSVNKFKVGDVVKCVDSGDYNNLSVGKEYVLIEIIYGMLEVENDKGIYDYYSPHRFELSKGSANAQQTHKSPKFKEGDMVYLIGFDCLKPHKLVSTDGDGYFTMKFKVMFDDNDSKTFTEDGCYTNSDITPRIVLATEENRLILNKLLGVEYEPLKLTGSDLAKKLLKDKPQTCYMSDISDDIALSDKCIDLIAKFENDRFITMSGIRWDFAVPCDKHGEVLDDE